MLTDMAQKLSILVFLALFLYPAIAFPSAFTRRGLLWDDSAWQNGIVGAGAAGIGILNQLWNQLAVPDPTLRSLQEEEPSEPEPPNTPDPLLLPLHQPSGVEQCANFGVTNKKSVISPEMDDMFVVSQDPGTGRPTMSYCDSPEVGAYIVHDIRFDGGQIRRFWKRWHAAILVTETETNEDIKYQLYKDSAKFIVRKTKDFKFMQNGKVMKLGYMRKRGWIVGAGSPKEDGLRWFEQFIGLGGAAFVTQNFVNGNEAYHFTSDWTRRIFLKLFDSGSPHWVPEDDGKQLPP